MPEASTAPPAPKGPDRSIRVLLVVGDKALANTVDLTLRHGTYLRRVAGNLDEARSAIADWRPHLLVVDIDIESGRAIQLIDDARVSEPIGIIALTRRSDLRGKLDALWGTDFVIESNVVDRHVRALRVKLQNDWHKPRYIETVQGAGYRFVPTSDPKDS